MEVMHALFVRLVLFVGSVRGMGWDRWNERTGRVRCG